MWRKPREILLPNHRPKLKDIKRKSTDRTNIRATSPTSQKILAIKKTISHNPIMKCNTARTI
jgi:hypothetical protein